MAIHEEPFRRPSHYNTWRSDNSSTSCKTPSNSFSPSILKNRKQGANLEPVDHVQALQIAEGKEVRIRGELEQDIKKDISKVLTRHSDSFALKATEIMGVDPRITSHNMNINLGIKPII